MRTSTLFGLIFILTLMALFIGYVIDDASRFQPNKRPKDRLFVRVEYQNGDSDTITLVDNSANVSLREGCINSCGMRDYVCGVRSFQFIDVKPLTK